MTLQDVRDLAEMFPPSETLAIHKDSCTSFRPSSAKPETERVRVTPVENFTVSMDFACAPCDGHYPGCSVSWLHNFDGKLYKIRCAIDVKTLASWRFNRTIYREDNTEVIHDTCLDMTKAGRALRHRIKYAQGSHTSGHRFVFYNISGEGSLVEWLSEAIQARGRNNE